MTSDALWFVGRGSGVISLVLLTVVVALGIGARSGRTPFDLPRFAVNLLHRNAALTAIVFLAAHIISLLIDPLAPITIFDAIFPFSSTYRPFWQGLGTLGMELMAAILLTTLFRHRLGARGWRAVHWLAYLCWPVALAHGLGTGSDNNTWWLWAITMICLAAVAAAVFWRVSPRFDPPRRRVAVRPFEEVR
ncbi:ferric reductase [Actinoplanes sp. TBRC 11911]|uniref:ferric reductase-like transmembrane domain-containing protein n=1 Tax=Actinoplanes sp. TBRC 11911 TaxID=2729386 RepID=UPI00145CF8BD|nr:ferric reductase-like transmembrane domain-containing protein [Actinoplanes sp. TBRC 11911]NMO54583.1 ferric reductase [Actinoplanes sp. TBRC 11911]